MAEENQNKAPAAEQDLNQLRKVRREKLAELQQAGQDPFVITKYDQTRHTDEVKSLYEEHEKEILKSYTEMEVPPENRAFSPLSLSQPGSQSSVPP